MFEIFSEGLSVLGTQFAGVAAFITVSLGIGLMCLDATVGQKIGSGIKLLLAFNIGGVLFSVIALALVIMAQWAPVVLISGGFTVLLICVVRIAIELRHIKTTISANILVSVVALAGVFFLIVARLAFMSPLLLPPYTDSVIHFQIVRGFLTPELATSSNLSLRGLTDNYYHFGFHSLSAWMTAVIKKAPDITMPLLGQLFMVVAPLSVATFTLRVTNSKAAAWWSAVMAALAWSMPAFAANWGKYPAMVGLATIPGVLATINLIWSEGRGRVSKILWGGLLLGAVTLVHTRMLIIAALVAVSSLLARRLAPTETISIPRAIWFSFLYIISLAPVYGFLQEFYSSLMAAVLVLCLLPFAFQAQIRLVLGIFFFTFGVWLVAVLPSFSTMFGRALLNRQMVQMLLYLPLAVLAGAGFGGLWHRFAHGSLRSIIIATATVLTFVLGYSTQETFYPNHCCDYFQEGDRQAFEWIAANSTERSLFFVAAFKERGQFFGTDAGVWITALTFRNSNRLPFDTDWRSSEEIQNACEAGAREIYIYSGGREFSFADKPLKDAAWADIVFHTAGTTIFHVPDCDMLSGSIESDVMIREP